jgi:hypothetical protein
MHAVLLLPRKDAGCAMAVVHCRARSAFIVPATKYPAAYAALFADFRYSSTSSAWPSGFTFSKICSILPSGPITNVVRATPITFLPYMFFSFRTPKALATVLSASASNGKGRLYFSENFFSAATVSGETPSSTAPVF